MGFGIGLKSHGRRPMKNGFRPIFRLANDPLLDEKKLQAFFPGDYSIAFFFARLNDFVLLKFLSLGTARAANRHTIILMQTSPNKATRTFKDYDSISQAMHGICALYERKLKDLYPTIQHLSYDISDLYNFIDGLQDLSALVYDHSIQAYLPYDRQWIKQRTFQHLRKMSTNQG